jgi:hypothetical protein
MSSLIDELPGVVEIDKAIAEPTRDIAWSGTNAKQQARSNARSMRLLCDAGPYTFQVFLAIAICEFARDEFPLVVCDSDSGENPTNPFQTAGHLSPLVPRR